MRVVLGGRDLEPSNGTVPAVSELLHIKLDQREKEGETISSLLYESGQS